MAIKQSEKTVTLNKNEYDALVHCVQVTKEYLRGEHETFDSAEGLIKNLKKL